MKNSYIQNCLAESNGFLSLFDQQEICQLQKHHLPITASLAKQLQFVERSVTGEMLKTKVKSADGSFV